ncbi:MAG: hypothetical protein U0640_07275 [Phycisphaerales bacterium]
MSDMLFPDAAPPKNSEEELLVATYLKVGRTLDDLAYTDDFDALYNMLPEPRKHRAAVIHRLQNLRKANKLPRLGRAVSQAIKVTPEEESILAQLVIDACGTIGQRDQLLYEERFDTIVSAFNEKTSRNLTPHDVWRLIAKIAK